MALLAHELHQRGIDHANCGRYAAARRSLALALSRTDDLDLRARIVGSMACVSARTGQPAQAEELCREALATEGLSPTTQAVLEGQLGLLASESGDWDTALVWLDRSIAGLEADPQSRSSMHLNRGVVHAARGRLPEAKSDYLSAGAYFEAAEDAVGTAMVRHNLGHLALVQGDLLTALAQMDAARDVMQAGSTVNAALGDRDRAEVLRDAGLTTEAEQTLERAARTFGAHRMQQARAEAEFALARSLMQHDPRRAAQVATNAVRRFKALGSKSWATRAEGLRLSAKIEDCPCHIFYPNDVRQQVPPKADEVSAAARDLESIGFPYEATSLRLRLIRWRARHEKNAVLPRATRLSANAPIEVRLLAHEVQVAHLAGAGRNIETCRTAARGLDELARWQRTFGSLELQSSTAMHGHRLTLEGRAAALRSRRPELIFEWSERARMLSHQVVPLRPPPDPELAADLAELRRLRADPAGRLTEGPEAAALRDRARRRQWTDTGAVKVYERVTLDELRASLDAETAFASYVYGVHVDTLFCVVATDQQTQLIEVCPRDELTTALAGLRADLDVSATVRSGPMAEVVEAALVARLDNLARLLITPIMPVIGDRRLGLTAPGFLAGVPWQMLPGLRGRPFNLAVSASRWVNNRDRFLGPGVGLAVGPGVQRGNDEIERAAKAWPNATILQGPQATVDAVTALASQVGLLHVAAHGRHAIDNPLFSGLELADGTLFGYDIDRMPKMPDVVVLSACEVGRSAVRWGEEALGMTRAWLHAGVACVIATPVAVADDVASEVLSAFHLGLAAGKPPAEALASVGIRSSFLVYGCGF